MTTEIHLCDKHLGEWSVVVSFPEDPARDVPAACCLDDTTARGLTALKLSGNDLPSVGLPPALFPTLSLGSLQVLWLDGNALTELPAEIGGLRSLQQLALHDNALESLPDTLGDLHQLQHLTLDRNRLRRLPDAMCRLHAMHTLHVDGNLLESLPEELGQLRSLADLGLGHNPLLRRLPPTLALCDSLMVIWAEGVPVSASDAAAASAVGGGFDNVPPQVLAAGAVAVKDHLRAQLPPQSAS